LQSRYSPEQYTHLSETLFATKTLTLKVKIIYAVKDDSETKLHIVLYLSYFPRDGDGFIRGL